MVNPALSITIDRVCIAHKVYVCDQEHNVTLTITQIENQT